MSGKQRWRRTMAVGDWLLGEIRRKQDGDACARAMLHQGLGKAALVRLAAIYEGQRRGAQGTAEDGMNVDTRRGGGGVRFRDDWRKGMTPTCGPGA